jgi:hypothetical protein
MLRKLSVTLTAVCTLTGAFQSVGATTPDAAYLAGRWEINSTGACGRENAEHLTVNKDATFDYGRRGKVEAVGFWRIEHDVVVFEMLTSPAYFQDIANELKDYTHHEIYSMRMLPLDMQPDHFTAVAVIDDQMSKLALQRCR